uniref:Rhodanese domain-containing protein n=1 Tax=Ananas comosus var. bracteatus TaxID=296719 RepID=A0A6V7Q0B2_ANACO|nr:unnamed protein product [Ananas comosus var. bracteatus]
MEDEAKMWLLEGILRGAMADPPLGGAAGQAPPTPLPTLSPWLAAAGGCSMGPIPLHRELAHYGVVTVMGLERKWEEEEESGRMGDREKHDGFGEREEGEEKKDNMRRMRRKLEGLEHGEREWGKVSRAMNREYVMPWTSAEAHQSRAQTRRVHHNLKSLAACEQLYNAGFRNLFWIQGGLEAAEEEDLQREGPQPFKLAGIGGVSEFFGWTDQQRALAAKEGWSYRLVFTGRLIGLIILVDALYLGTQKLGLCFKNCALIEGTIFGLLVVL